MKLNKSLFFVSKLFSLMYSIVVIEKWIYTHLLAHYAKRAAARGKAEGNLGTKPGMGGSFPALGIPSELHDLSSTSKFHSCRLLQDTHRPSCPVPGMALCYFPTMSMCWSSVCGSVCFCHAYPELNVSSKLRDY